MGLKKVHSFSLGFHSMVFEAEIYAIKACIMENIEKGYLLTYSMEQSPS